MLSNGAATVNTVTCSTGLAAIAIAPSARGLARAHWLEQRRAELLPVEYFHVVLTVPEPISAIAFYNKAVVYDILFRATSKTLLTIAAHPKRLGVELGFFAVLHSWGQNLHFHPHLHCVVPGGGLSSEEDAWIHGRPRFLLPVKVLSALFRRLFLEQLHQAHAAGKLEFFGDLADLSEPLAFARYLAPLEKSKRVVYAKPPFGGPQKVLECLGRYTHRVAIPNSRLLAMEDGQVTFAWKDYRDEQKKEMTVTADEFIRRFLLHSLPPGFQRIRYYGFLANCHRAAKLDLCRRLLSAPASDLLPRPADYRDYYQALTGKDLRRCPQCGTGVLIRLAVLGPALLRLLNTNALSTLTGLDTS